MGVGAQNNFAQAQDFLQSTGVGGSDSELTMLWEQSGNIWNMNNVRVNSAMQLLSFDATQQSSLIFFNDDGRDVVLGAMTQEPWAPSTRAEP